MYNGRRYGGGVVRGQPRLCDEHLRVRLRRSSRTVRRARLQVFTGAREL